MESEKGSSDAVMKSSPQGYPPLWLTLSVWGLGAGLFLIGFFNRFSPAVMTQELMIAFGIGAAGLGNLSAVYYYAYVVMQVPTGVMADTLGPRKLLIFGAVGASLGAFLFSLSPNLLWATLGRAFIGISVSVGFISTLKLTSTWFPPQRFALASGLAHICGVLGAVLAGAPLRILINHFGWRPIIFVTGMITAALAIAIWRFVRNDPSEKGFTSYLPPILEPSPAGHRASLFSGLRAAFRYSNIRLLTFAAGGIVGPFLTFAGLWGVPYLKVRFGLPATQTALVCSGVPIASAVAGPVLGGLSDWLGRKPIYLGGSILATSCWAALIFAPGISFKAFIVLMLFAGFGSGSSLIGFAYGKESVPPHLSGRAIGIINMGAMCGPTVLQPAIGMVLDLMWDGQMSGGARVYDVNAFKAGFSLMIGWAVLGCVLISRTRDTLSRQRF